MNEITLEYLQEKISERYFAKIPHKTLSKKELLERLKNLDYERLNKALEDEKESFQELSQYAQIGELYCQISPDFNGFEFKERFSKEECLSIARDFFYKENPELAAEFNKYLATSQLSENEKNINKDGVVHVRIKEERNTIKELFSLIHEFTHSFKKSIPNSHNRYENKLTETPTLLNELYFLDYIISLNDPELSKEAINYIIYKLNDNKYEAIPSIITNDLAKIYLEKGKIDYPSMKEYVEQLDLSSLKGLLFLQIGDIFLNSKIEGKSHSYWYQGRYIISELIASKFHNTKDFNNRLIELCEVIGKTEDELTKDDLDKLYNLGITYVNETGEISFTEEDINNLKGHFLILLEYLNALNLKLESEYENEQKQM